MEQVPLVIFGSTHDSDWTKIRESIFKSAKYIQDISKKFPEYNCHINQLLSLIENLENINVLNPQEKGLIQLMNDVLTDYGKKKFIKSSHKVAQKELWTTLYNIKQFSTKLSNGEFDFVYWIESISNLERVLLFYGD